ncbi:tetratricopeptide repeat protein [Chitinimonas arctica]|nr:tetratricopeptide repeat protein [Chitinimonas arctica]
MLSLSTAHKHLLASLLLLSALCSHAATLEDGLAAYKAKDYQVAAPIFQALADQGNADAQNNLGLIYWKGLGTTKDNQRARELFEKAAEQNHVNAHVNLGVIYALGDGVPEDAQLAYTWIRKAADRGDAFAQYFIGLAYLNGEGVGADPRQALIWLRKSAEQGFDKALLTLGLVYSDDKHLKGPKRLIVPYALFILAAPHQDAAKKAMTTLAQTMTAAHIKSAEALAREMQAPRNLLKALDSYLSSRRQGSQTVSNTPTTSRP